MEKFMRTDDIFFIILKLVFHWKFNVFMKTLYFYFLYRSFPMRNLHFKDSKNF